MALPDIPEPTPLPEGQGRPATRDAVPPFPSVEGTRQPAPPVAMGPVLAAIAAGLIAAAIIGAGIALWFHDQTSRTEGVVTEREFDYDIQELLHVDPKLVLYEDALSFDVGLEEPRALDMLPGDVVGVVGDSALRTFDAGGEPVSHILLAGPPQCLEGGSAGGCLVGFKDHIEVYEVSSGTRKAVWESLGKAAFLVSIAASPGAVYVGDAGQRVIWKLDAAGKPTGTIGKRDADRGIGGFVVPSPHLDVAVAADGLLRAVNPGRHRIEAYTPEGDLELYWGKPSMGIDGFSGCCNPCSIALLPDGGVITGERGIPRVKLYDAHGVLLGVVAAPEKFAEGERALRGDWREGSGGGLDVAIDSRGRVLVLDPLARLVRIFVRAGKT